MRVLLTALALSTLIFGLGACQTCPDGSSNDSLFCHSGDCAAGESVCGGVCSNPQTDRDNCGRCGNTCGDGMICSNSMCVEGCPGDQTSCAGVCTDTQTDEMNCGGCGSGETNVCNGGESCVSGGCVCTSGVVCTGQCVDPMTDNMHCGATTDCLGGNGGMQCGAMEGCVGGTCVSRLIYRGSLTATRGIWSYQGQPGITGANAECGMRWPGSSICSYEKLLMASQRVVPETMGATDHMGNPVAKWWVHDPMALPTNVCTNNNSPLVPWTYATADQGHRGRQVVLTPATGAISAVQLIERSCMELTHVPCCSTVIAP